MMELKEASVHQQQQILGNKMCLCYFFAASNLLRVEGTHPIYMGVWGEVKCIGLKEKSLGGAAASEF